MTKVYQKNYYLKNKDKIQIRKKRWYLKNKDKIKNRVKKYYLKNKDKIKNRPKNESLNNKVKEYHKQYYLKNKEKKKEYDKKYLIKNKYKINKRHKTYIKKRRDLDINYKLLCNLRSRLSQAIKKKNKSNRTAELIGCTFNNLIFHLQSKFQEGMNWDNYGKWHIDHIKPCSSFDLTNIAEQYKCFHYTNLQPLWAEDNLKKSNKL